MQGIVSSQAEQIWRYKLFFCTLFVLSTLFLRQSYAQQTWAYLGAMWQQILSSRIPSEVQIFDSLRQDFRTYVRASSMARQIWSSCNYQDFESLKRQSGSYWVMWWLLETVLRVSCILNSHPPVSRSTEVFPPAVPEIFCHIILLRCCCDFNSAWLVIQNVMDASSKKNCERLEPPISTSSHYSTPKPRTEDPR
jgi:hypothetical protein